MRRTLSSGLILCALLTACGGAAGPKESPPDVFLIVIDTLRADRMSAYGWPRPTTPRLDQLAAEGVRFADATSQSSWTKPSMVSLWTGQYVTAYQDRMHADQPCLAEALGYEGYATIGVAGNVLLSEVEGFDRGFDYYDARRLTAKERMARRRTHGSSGPCRDAVELIEDFLAPIDAFLERTTQQQDGDRQPLFAYLHPMEPHSPYLVHPTLEDELPQGHERRTFPSDWHKELWEREAVPSLTDGGHADGAKEAWQVMAGERVRYERELRYLDDLLGGLLEGLEERGLLEDAVVIVASDHGEALWDNREITAPQDIADLSPDTFFQKQHGSNLTQGLVGTPLFFWGKGIPRGVVIDAPVENVDLFPTLLELSGAEPSDALHGRSLGPLMRGETETHKPYVHAFVMTNVMVREAETNQKLVMPTRLGTEQGASPAFYELGSDPMERTNLIRTMPAESARMQEVLRAWERAHPTRPTNPLMKDPTTLDDLRALGYLGDD